MLSGVTRSFAAEINSVRRAEQDLLLSTLDGQSGGLELIVVVINADLKVVAVSSRTTDAIVNHGCSS